MSPSTIATRRIIHQHIGGAVFNEAAEVVRWLGAVQAQDYQGALWGIGLRTANSTEHLIETAIADRSIVRTWPMRGTLHFVPAEDVRWMLKLLTPRIIARSAGRYRQLELDERTFSRSRKLLTRALQRERQLTRREMYSVLEDGNIQTSGQRGIHVLSRLAQEGLICFAARKANQQTFALLEEWIPHERKLGHDQGLMELARRYFSSRGPATLEDFIWWSGLKSSDARTGLEMAKPHLAEEVITGQSYWSLPDAKSQFASGGGLTAHLLPAFDEYTVAYRDRSAVFSAKHATQIGNGIFSPVIIVQGRIVGTWKRVVKNGSVITTPHYLTPLKKTERAAVAAAATRYGSFLNATAIIT